MTGSADPVPTTTTSGNSKQRSGWLICLLTTWGLLVTWSLCRVPVPGVNETHYLTKAKYFWNPDWCSGDLFLSSSNPHFVFYVTIGGLTKFLTLQQTAVVGRIAGLFILACGWQKLAQVWTGHAWGAVLALPWFAILQVLGNWSGEWLVGGIESKVFGYGFLLWSLGAWLQQEWIKTGTLLGLAISFHPIVGCWGLVGLMLASLATWLSPADQHNTLSSTASPARRSIWIAAFSGFLLALPGLIPALSTLSGNSKQDSLTADYLQFAGRLSHHLDPLMFPVESHRYFAMQLAVWGLLMVLTSPGTPVQKRWQKFVLATLIVAGVGVLLAAGPRPVKSMPGWEWRISLLKFYPFRLADLVLPLTLSLAGSNYLRHVCFASRRRYLSNLTIMIAVYLISLLVPGTDRNPAHMTPDRLERWIDSLNWIQKNTDPADLIYCYDEQYAVRWFAERPEYVNYKDCPQDARGLLEWNRRLWLITQWNRKAYLYGDGLIDSRELAELHRQTGIKWLVVSRKIQVRGTIVHTNRDFVVVNIGTDF